MCLCMYVCMYFEVKLVVVKINFWFMGKRINS